MNKQKETGFRCLICGNPVNTSDWNDTDFICKSCKRKNKILLAKSDDLVDYIADDDDLGGGCGNY